MCQNMPKYVKKPLLFCWTPYCHIKASNIFSDIFLATNCEAKITSSWDAAKPVAVVEVVANANVATRFDVDVAFGVLVAVAVTSTHVWKMTSTIVNRSSFYKTQHCRYQLQV